jgi:hypothetical protein
MSATGSVDGIGESQLSVNRSVLETLCSKQVDEEGIAR